MKKVVAALLVIISLYVLASKNRGKAKLGAILTIALSSQLAKEYNDNEPL